MRREIALLFGGKSAEHEVSLRSARAIYEALKGLHCSIHCIGIDRAGIWHYQTVIGEFPGAVDETAPEVSLRLGRPSLTFMAGDRPVEVELDAIYPALHGPWGEDGTIQGLAALSNLPCVGSSTLGSAVAMDKDVTKRLLREQAVSVAPSLTCCAMPAWSEVVLALGSTIFVKPASLGSSVGVRRVDNEADFKAAFESALCWDPKILLETAISGREIECGVLEVGGRLVVSELGEISPVGGHQFYDYAAKYQDEHGAKLLVPADVTPDVKARVQELAMLAFSCLGLRTLARVDFFVTDAGEIILNEVNTLPGFTSISMYPRMFEQSGYPIGKLVEAILANTLEGGREESHG